MKIIATWYGTVALHIVVEDRLGIFLDPYLERPEGAWPRISADPETVNLEPLDAVFVSHSHFDHILHLPNLIRRYPSARAYVPMKTVGNCRKLCTGATFKGHSYELSEGDWSRFHVITAGDRVELASADGTVQLKATAIRAAHVKFDAYSILRVLLNWRLWQRFGYYVKFMTGFPKKEVVGWELQVSTADEAKRFVYFGSMCKEHLDVLAMYGGSDYFIVPLAGRRDVLPHARAMTEAVNPQAVIPAHYDDFFPPISYRTDWANYEKWLATTRPETRLITLQAEEPTLI